MRGLLLLLVLSLSTPALAAEKTADKLIYKIDSVIANISHQTVLIQAKGAVPSGGWKGVKLKLVHPSSDPHTSVVEFVAAPPPPGAMVIQGLLPVSATTQARLHKGVVAVRVVSSANEITTQILK